MLLTKTRVSELNDAIIKNGKEPGFKWSDLISINPDVNYHLVLDWLKFHTILAEAKKVCYCKATTSKKRHEPRCPAGVIKNIIDKYKDD